MAASFLSVLVCGAGFFVVWKMVGDWPLLSRSVRIGLSSTIVGLLMTSRYAIADQSPLGMMLAVLYASVLLGSARALLSDRATSQREA